MHLYWVLLLLLGPLGHQVNVIVWPWNLAMVALAIVLFGVGDGAPWPEAWAALRRSGLALVVLGLFCLPTALGFVFFPLRCTPQTSRGRIFM